MSLINAVQPKRYKIVGGKNEFDRFTVKGLMQNEKWVILCSFAYRNSAEEWVRAEIEAHQKEA